MTFIYDVVAGRRSGTTVTGLVHCRDTDNYGYPRSPEFGLKIIVGAWREFSRVGTASATEAELKELYELVLRRAEFARRAAEIIVSFDLDEGEEGRRRFPGFTIEVSDPRYLDHFPEDQSRYFQMT
ncbi:hypothetical protein [Streptosporangium sp. KLBMP 9127]|nr:hypothetical protein [Streptosporangium sp. KLBMP 9127]